jgi:hypothetical protein
MIERGFRGVFGCVGGTLGGVEGSRARFHFSLIGALSLDATGSRDRMSDMVSRVRSKGCVAGRLAPITC